MKTYITFGQSHFHSVNGTTFDKDCVAVINSKDEISGQNRAFELFGMEWCFCYTENTFDFDSMKFFPRGFIEVK